MNGPDKRIERTALALENGGRILVTRLGYLGDVILTLPLVDALRERWPRARIDYLCRPPSSELLIGDSRFDEVIEVQPSASFAESLALIRRLRRRRYAVVIDLYSNPRSAWLSWLSCAPLRIGGDRRGRRMLYTHVISVPPEIRSAMMHHLTFGAPLDVALGTGDIPGKPSIALAPEEIEKARDRLESHGVETRRPDGPRIGLHPGGKWEVKRWPVGAFAELATRLAEDWNAVVVAFTGPGESEHTEQLAERAGDGVVVLPELSVREVAAVLSLLDGMVVSDGGVMHLSVAVGTPTVGIFGSAEPDIWFPYEKYGPFAPALVPLDCRPCHEHVCPLGHINCLNELTTDMVLDRLRGVLSYYGGGRDARDDGRGEGA